MHEVLPHAETRVPAWTAAWRASGRLVVLLDFDGTLSPIVARPELARPAPGAAPAVRALRDRAGVAVAVVSGRGLTDARERLGIEGIVYAGNHGMEIEGPRLHRIHPEAEAARPQLERVIAALAPVAERFAGALLEDKGLTLSIHYRQVDPVEVPELRRVVSAATGAVARVRLTEGKKVLEVRPAVEWDKGRAVEFLLESFAPPSGSPVLYLGDDTTDEDAFRVLATRSEVLGEGVLVRVSGGSRSATAARSYLRDPAEVVEILRMLAES